MNRHFLSAAGTALALLLGVSTAQEAGAQVYAEYRPAVKVGNRPYTPINGQVIPANEFRLPPQTLPSDPADRDDGYVRRDLGFTFTFAGRQYTQVWISVNGFLTFTNTQPPNVPAADPRGLFRQSPSIPINVVAPYWGDHYYRVGAPTDPTETGYVPSAILTQSRGTAPNRVFVVEWRNLNINNEASPSSIGNFQAYLYESPNADSANFQGDVEFAYGQVGGNGPTVFTQGAAIGIKGEFADFLNALAAPNPATASADSTTLSNQWPPTGGTDTVFRFNVIRRLFVDRWGDGDADLSQAPQGKHFGLPQNRFVTMSDVRAILRAKATNVPLDSVRGRNAFHGDVNHNGRYYYSTRNASNTADVARYKRLVETRAINYNDPGSYAPDNSLPFDIEGNPVFFFEANELDAAYIMHYMAARIPTLPWLLDTVVPYGKVAIQQELATGITVPGVQTLADGSVRFPIYTNGSVNGPIALSFNVDGVVSDVAVVRNGDNQIVSDFSDKNVVIAGTGVFNANEAVAYVTVKTNNGSLNLGDVRFNDRNNAAIQVAGAEANASDMLAQNFPNPFSTTTSIAVTVPTAGTYTVAIYDVMGNLVKTLHSGNLAAGTVSLNWDGTAANGAAVASGTYIYRLDGEGVVVARKLTLNR